MLVDEDMKGGGKVGVRDRWGGPVRKCKLKKACKVLGTFVSDTILLDLLKKGFVNGIVFGMAT